MNTCIFHVLGCRAYGCFAKLACWLVYVANKTTGQAGLTKTASSFCVGARKMATGMDEKDAAMLVFVG